MKLITGAGGFVGEFLVREIFKRSPKEKVMFFIRNTTNKESLMKFPSKFVYGDLEDIDLLEKAMRGVTEVIHLAGIDYSLNVIRAAKKSGVKRVVLVHTTWMFSKYQKHAEEYKQIESMILDEPVNYTILRPTMIYGSRRNKNIHKIILFINKYHFYPFIGSDKCLIQPIYAGDVAKACLDVLKTKKTVRKAYNIAGESPLTWRELVNTVAKTLDIKVRTLRIPLWFSILAVRAYKIVSRNPKISVENILRFNENKNFDITSAKKDFGFEPLSFEEGIRTEIEEKRDLL